MFQESIWKKQAGENQRVISPSCIISTSKVNTSQSPGREDTKVILKNYWALVVHGFSWNARNITICKSWHLTLEKEKLNKTLSNAYCNPGMRDTVSHPLFHVTLPTILSDHDHYREWHPDNDFPWPPGDKGPGQTSEVCIQILGLQVLELSIPSGQLKEFIIQWGSMGKMEVP